MTKCGPLSSKTTLVDGIFAHLGLSENKGHGQRTGRRGREGWRDNCMVWRKRIKRRWLMTPIIPTEFWSRMAPKKARSHFSEHSTINFSRRDLQKVLIFNQNTSHNIFSFWISKTTFHFRLARARAVVSTGCKARFPSRRWSCLKTNWSLKWSHLHNTELFHGPII